MNRGKNLFFEIATLVLVLALSALAIWGAAMGESAYLLPAVACIGLVIIAFSVLRFTLNPDHLRATQSESILQVANETQRLLSKGLSNESAHEVCRTLLPATAAAAIAITDHEEVLGFAGIGEDHHKAGRPILTKATKSTIRDGKTRLLKTKKEIGCPDEKCKLKAAIVVPLEVLDETVGTLKFYYGSPRALTETRIAVAKGFGSLLSTQLGIAELDKLAELTARAELRALQSQINPHFLFNTINTIASLIRTDPAQARILLREFAVFYRRTLENSEDLISLDQEVEQTMRYLGFEVARFGEDRIDVKTDIDPELEGLPVPAFIVQPVVENAVNHGMPPDKPLQVSVSARRNGKDVQIVIVDNGIGIPPEKLPKLMIPDQVGEESPRTGMGIALKNVDDRLKGYFGTESGITIESELNKGTTVTLALLGAANKGRG